MSHNGIEDGWRRFLDRLKQLWGKVGGRDFGKTPGGSPSASQGYPSVFEATART